MFIVVTVASSASSYLKKANTEVNAKAHANNIANVDTPGYKRKDVTFESYLRRAVSGGSSLDDEIANADLSELTATTFVDYANVDYRLDGNNVDIDTENAELAKNQIKYYTMIDSISQEFSRLKSVMGK